MVPLFALALGAGAQTAIPPPETGAASRPQREAAAAAYVLGTDDQLSVWASDAPDFAARAVTVDAEGNIKLPLIGAVRARGRTVQQLEADIRTRLGEYIREPQVAVTVTEYRSQPVSVIGAVNTPGLHQLRGRKTLVEILSVAGGLRQDAGPRATITRRAENGKIPLPGAKDDASGEFSTAEVNLESVITARDPAQNIVVLPNDVISVPKAQMVYVVGEVMKAGGFVLNERKDISVLQALALAGGLTRMAAAKNARVLRVQDGASRADITVNIQKILDGKEKDVPLGADDILFIPGSGSKRVAARAIESVLQAATGVVIWRGANF